MDNESMLSLKGIKKSFYINTPNELEILHGINLDIKKGEFVSIVGASGSGTVDSGSNSANISLVDANEGYISYNNLNLLFCRLFN